MPNIKFGDTLIGFDSDNREFDDIVERKYGPFIAPGEPDFRIKFSLDENLSPTEVKSLLKATRVYQEGYRYFTSPNLIDCRLNWKERSMSLRTQKAIFNDEVDYRFMSLILRGVYSGIIKILRKSSFKYYIVHGCGVTDKGRFYLFTGPSGTGKTTVASLAGHRTVLNDEAVLIRHSGSRIYLAGSALDGQLRDKSVLEGELNAIFFLEHAPDVRLTRLSPAEAYRMFLCQVFDTSPLFEKFCPDTLEERAEISSTITQSVPCFRLGFKPDNSFWEVVESAS